MTNKPFPLLVLSKQQVCNRISIEGSQAPPPHQLPRPESECIMQTNTQGIIALV